MRKLKYLALVLALMLGATCFGCGGGGEDGNNPSTGGVDVEPLVIAGLDSNYYPNMSAVTKQAGKIDVSLVFDSTLSGWQKVKAEYERIHPSVLVQLDPQASSNYDNAATNAINDSSTDWDFFQGNRVGTRISQVAQNMSMSIYTPNPYAGGGTWVDVLSEEAYITDKTGTNTDCYIMNSESLSTAWFVNETAFAAAVEKGYVNAKNEAETPITWDDLINLCAKMAEAGYTNPMGLSGNVDSVNNAQFAWLYRVYGDQFYRDMYSYINVQEGDNIYDEGSYDFNFSLTDPQPESDRGYNPSVTKLWNTILEKVSDAGLTNANYVGPESEKFACFISNLAKLKQYLPDDFATVSFNDMRDRFISAEGDNKSAPAIFLDYTGFGLTFGTQTRGFTIDFFDYPAMTCEHTTKHVTTDFVRDVGGNGGYLSMINHSDSAQNLLNLDFMKFFMSPYGQSIYYQGMYEASVAPNGISTVQNMVIPEAWDEFFHTDKISYNGLCDSNLYCNHMIYHVNGNAASKRKHAEIVGYLMDKRGSYTVAQYQEAWDDAVWAGYEDLCNAQFWSLTMYKRPGTLPNASE